METGKAIYKLLKDSSAVGAICADRIYPEFAQQDADAPFVVYTVTDTQPGDTKTSTSKIDTARVEVYCVGDNYDTLMNLGIAVRGALDRQGGDISGVQVQSISFDTSDVQFDPDQRLYVLEHTYNVRIQRTGTAGAVTLFPSNTWTIEEVDGGPSGAVNKLIVSNATLTIDGNTATLDTGGGGGNVTSVNSLTGLVELYGTNLLVQLGQAVTIKGKFDTTDANITDLFNIIKGTAQNALGVFSDTGDLTKPSLNVGSTNAILRGGTATLIKAEQTSPGTLTFAVAAGANDTETTAMIISGQANGNVMTSFSLEVRFTGTVNFSSGSATVSFSGSTAGIDYGDLDNRPTIPGVLSDLTNVAGTTPTDGQALVFDTTNGWQPETISGGGGTTYHNRYASDAETKRSGATVTTELYYTARPDGDGLAESATSDSGVTDTINRKLFFATKFDANPDTAADWTEYTTQPADNATFATAKAALLAGLNVTDGTANTRGTLPLSLKIERTTTSTVNLLLDSYPNAAAAYSVRKLDKDYSGSCMKVRRDSDDAEQDIGFDSNGDVDSSAIATFAGSANAFVSVWYDQANVGGTSKDQTQTTAGNQPKIYDGSAVITENGKPAIQFDGSNDGLNCATNLRTSTGASTVIQVRNVIKSNVQQQPFAFHKVQRHFIEKTGSTAYDVCSISTSETSGEYIKYASADLSSQVLQFATWDGSTQTSGVDETILSQNGSLESGTVGSSSFGTPASACNSIGFRKDINRGFSLGTFQEVVIYLSDETSNRSAIETDINTHFSIF